MDDELKKRKRLLRAKLRPKRTLKLRKEKNIAELRTAEISPRQLAEQRITANLFALLVSHVQQHYANCPPRGKENEQSPIRIMLYHPLPVEVNVLQTIVLADHYQYLAPPKCTLPQMPLQKNHTQNTVDRHWQHYYRRCFHIVSRHRKPIATAVGKKSLQNEKAFPSSTAIDGFPIMQFYLPRITSLSQARMIAAPARLDNLQKNSKLGIMEPQASSAEVAANRIAVVVAPGLAYDENGIRLGYGGGYYDRFFADADKAIPQLKVGVFRSWQRSSIRLPREENDVALDIAVHEDGFEYFG